MRTHRISSKSASTRTDDASACVEAGPTPGVPSCDTGPAGRLAWTVHEILDIIRRRG